MEQRRFLVAMILSGLVIFVWQAFFAPAPPEDLETEEIVAEEVDPDAPPEDLDEVDEPAEPEEVDEPAELADVEEIEDVDEVDDPDVDLPDVETQYISTSHLDVQLTNQGAVVSDVQVTAPRQYAGLGGELMRAFEGQESPDWPYSFTIEDGTITLEGDQIYEVVEEESTRAADGNRYEEIVYRYTDPGGNFYVDKVYGVDEDRRFVLTLDIEVHNTRDDVALAGEPGLNIIGRDDPDKEDNFFDFRPDVLEGVCHNTDGTEREVFDNLEEYTRFSQYSVIWAGADTRYFMMAAAPIDGAEACSFDAIGEDYLKTRLYHGGFTIQPEDSWSASHTLYMGPKDFDVLREAGHELEESVDYGLFTILARPLRWSLVRLYNFTFNWGLAIILLTFIIKAATWPITGKAYKNAERMKQIQPQIKELREKYENDQQRMTEETMKLFKENNASPLGCLPLLLQMPILYGLFVMIYNSVELYQAEFLWYSDLSAPDPFFILPIVMGGVMFVQQQLTMSTAATTNPQMKTVMKIMPIAFTAFMLFLPAGLVLYYLLNLAMGLGQQFLIKRKFRLAEEAGEEI